MTTTCTILRANIGREVNKKKVGQATMKLVTLAVREREGCIMTQQDLSDWTGISPDQAGDVARELRAQGLLKAERHGKNGTRYWINWPAWEAKQ